MTEMLVITAAVVLALVLPGPAGESVAMQLWRALREFGSQFLQWIAWI